MKTTIEVDPILYKRLKRFAAEAEKPIRAIIQIAIEHEISGAHALSQKRRVQFPLLKSNHPATLSLSNAQIEEFLT